ncbi:MAG: monofunctional biosynthetic peptidoglycan transglycosylase [Deltaproteobacteria bacterium]|nr:monofunctional biosynthetic peptidoglycan transglycosylase [Deltaproteobacteria bacterium]
MCPFLQKTKADFHFFHSFLNGSSLFFSKTLGPRSKKKSYQLFIFTFSLAAILGLAYLALMPDISRLKKENPAKTAFMEYREKQWREKGRKAQIHQVWVPLSRISPYLVKAVLIAEDDKFWSHEGFDYEGIKQAVEKDLQSGRLKFGGSTISQQLARNLYLSPAKSFWRKIREVLITWRMEQVLSKKRILELYLNVVEWGDGIFGAEAASRHYFEKPASELSPREAARLAVVLPSPRKLDPAGTQRYVESRAEVIYSIMLKRGIVPPEFEEDLQPPEKEESPLVQP